MTEASYRECWTRRLPQMDSALPRSPADHAIKRVRFDSICITVTVCVRLRMHIFMLRTTYIITLHHTSIFYLANPCSCRSQWPRGLRRRSAAARLLRSWVRIPRGAWMFVCCECCVLSGRGLCDELITRPEESYRLWCVVFYLKTL